jgi:hypothetical protein
MIAAGHSGSRLTAAISMASRRTTGTKKPTAGLVFFLVFLASLVFPVLKAWARSVSE